MTLRHLSLLHFRSYAHLEHDFRPRLNVIVGPNAEGKSNLLEAIYLLATTKSMRGGRDPEMIQWDQKVAVVGAFVARERTCDVELEVSLSHEGKLLAANGARVPRVTQFVGQLKAVAFSSADVDVVRGEPARRRRFLDLEISQASPAYCHTLACYRKVLEQRTRLLKSRREARSYGPGRARGGSPDLEETLAEWSAQLVRYGAALVARRARFVRRLQELARPVHAAMTGGAEVLGIGYRGSFPLPDPLAEEEVRAVFAEALSRTREEEMRRGLCLVGPHRDDLLFLFDGHDARTYGSQAQQRTVMLSARLAELELLREEAGEDPVCLLDDVLSELDDRRRAHLFEILERAGQVLLSCTELQALPAMALGDAAVHRVGSGGLETVQSPVAA